jgi:hypothetical protein
VFPFFLCVAAPLRESSFILFFFFRGSPFSPSHPCSISFRSHSNTGEQVVSATQDVGFCFLFAFLCVSLTWRQTEWSAKRTLQNDLADPRVPELAFGVIRFWISDFGFWILESGDPKVIFGKLIFVSRQWFVVSC